MPRSVTVGELADRLGAECAGDPEIRISGARPLDSAEPGDLSFLARRKYLPYLSRTRAAAVIVGRNLGEHEEEPPRGTALLWVDDAQLALARALSWLYESEPPEPEIAPTAVIGAGVELGQRVSIGPYAVVAEGARLADEVRVGAHTLIGEACQVGERTELKPQVTLYPGSVIGADCILHSGVRIGVDGYGYVQHEGEHRKVPQVGRCVIEDEVEIGANTTIDRGSLGETRVGAGTKIDNLVHIAHNVKIGRGCLIVAQVGIAGSTTLGDGVTLAGQVGIIGHLEIGDGAVVAAQSGVGADIPPGETWFGSPARARMQAMRARAAYYRLPELIRRVRRLEKQLDREES